MRLMDRDAALLVALARGAAVPVPWDHPRFAARVRVVRLHLALLHDRHLLAESLSREAGGMRRVAARPNAVRVAYAIRWLELSAGMAFPAWTAWVQPPER